VKAGKHTLKLILFTVKNEGLIVAEIELESETELLKVYY
jgi:CYTH domain-containing protein